MKVTELRRVLTLRQPWADLVIAGAKDVENRSWPPPSTLPQWGECDYHGRTAPDDLELCTDTPTVGDYWRHWPRDGYQCPVQLDGPYPFRLWIHAGLSTDDVNGERLHTTGLATTPEDRLLYVATMTLGALLGHVTVTGCHHADECRRTLSSTDEPRAGRDPFTVVHCSRWAQPDAYHWTLTAPVALAEPIPLRGRQGLWTLPEDLEVAA